VDLIEFFDSDQLELPGYWDTYPGSFEQFLAEVFHNYQTTLAAITPSDYLSDRILREANVANDLCTEVTRCLGEYLLGHPPRAYDVLSKVLRSVERCFKAMYTPNNISGVLEFLYRIRSDTRPALAPQDLFHVPFQLRHKVATFRYSIPGLPCLYLGGSAYVCWEECGCPPLNAVHVARFKPTAGTTIHVLDFGWRPAQWAALIRNGAHAIQLSRPSPASDLVTAQAVCWPLIAACSIRTRYQDAHFKPEYVLPQLVLQWITNETTLDGVRYFTTKTSRYFPDPMSVSNFAFPVRSTSPTSFCNHLAGRFELSAPVCWPAVAATAPAIGATLHTNFTLNPSGTPYNQTELGRLQHCAANLPCNRV
jgi:hypothetical protein